MNVGGSQDFRLTWVNYSQKLTESFHKFLTSEILCNVTLWVHESGVGGGTSIKAHQVHDIYFFDILNSIWYAIQEDCSLKSLS